MLTVWFTESLPLAQIALILALALVLDRILGDPPWLYRRLPHPVAIIGAAITWGEKRLRRPAINKPHFWTW